MTLGDLKVRRVWRDEHSYGHEPALDPEWSELTQARWWAAIHRIDDPEYPFIVEVGGYRVGLRDYEQHYLLKLNGWLIAQGTGPEVIAAMWPALATARMMAHQQKRVLGERDARNWQEAW